MKNNFACWRNCLTIFVGESISYVCYRAAFNRESVESDLALLCLSMLPDWFKKKSCFLLNQSDTKTKINHDFARWFSRALRRLRVFVSCSYCSLCSLRLLWFADYFGLDFVTQLSLVVEAAPIERALFTCPIPFKAQYFVCYLQILFCYQVVACWSSNSGDGMGLSQKATPRIHA